MASEDKLIELAVKSFVRQNEQTPCEPKDGLDWAMVELEPDDMTGAEYQALLDKVIDACVEGGHWTISQTEPYQMLQMDTFQKRFGDYVACEPFWRPISLQKVGALLSALSYTPADYQTSIFSAYWAMKKEWKGIEEGRSSGVTVEEAAQALLEAGQVISTPLCLLRKVTDRKKCPKCGCSIMDDVPAVSRVDNQTHLCSICGMQEALEDYFHEA